MKILNSLKIENLKLKINSRGEIATVLTLISVGLMLAGIIAGTKIAQNSTEQRTQAQNAKVRSQSSTLSGCQIVDTDNGPGCWCAKPDPGVWQFHCFSGATRGTPASTACTNNCTALNTGGGGGGGGAGDGTGTPTDGKSCSLSSLSPDVGDCGSCILGKSPGTKDFITSNTGATGCLDNQIASFWCNGGVSEDGKNQCQNLNSQCLAEKACTGKPITSPSPTGADGKGGGGGGGGGGVTPGPGGGGDDTTLYPNGYYVIKGSITNVSVTPAIPILSLVNIYYLPPGTDRVYLGESIVNQISVTPIPNNTTDSKTGLTSYNYQFGTDTNNYLIAQIDPPIAEVAQTSGLISFKDNTNEVLNYQTGPLKICYPYGKFIGGRSITVTPAGPTITITPTPIKTYLGFDKIIKFCSDNNVISTADFNASTYVTPTPAALKFSTYTHNSFGGRAPLFVQINALYVIDKDNSNTDLFTDDSNIPLQPIDGSTYPVTTTSLKSNTQNIDINISASLLEKQDSSNPPYKNLATCSNNEFPILLTQDLANKTNDLGKLIDIFVKVTTKTDEKDNVIYTYSCEIKPVTDSSRTFLGSANVDFDNTMAKWKNGEIDATQMSTFINQLTRVPGLQTTFCNPLKGECNL